MLASLTIKNTAIIDRLTVEFGDGMNCLTGETGAGKSIIIDSICCLLGERASRESIRRGCESASVQGLFYAESAEISGILNELGIEAEDDGSLILFREYTSGGRNTCRVNGQIVTLSMLRKLGECLVDVHGQHDNHSLLSPSTHIVLLDLFAGDEMLYVKERYAEKFNELREINNELDEISGDPEQRAAAVDLLTFQVNEITAAAIKPGEDEQLEQRREVLANAEKITEVLGSAYESLAGGDGGFYGGSSAAGGNVMDLLGNIVSDIENISKYNELYSQLLSKINESIWILEDAVAMLRNQKDEILFNPKEISDIDKRLDELYRLKRKYGGSIEAVLEYAETSSEKLEELESSEGRSKELNEKREAVMSDLRILAGQMYELRCEAVKRLVDGIHRELEDMEMGKVRFNVDLVHASDGKLTASGLDTAEFLICTNPGEPLRPLSKIASGGELSRIMLAIKSVLADIDGIPVLIFDEIDTGISGYAATKVACKFKNIARSHQVICVSHLAQIAAIAEHNIFVSKSYNDESVVTEAVLLGAEEKIREVSRLLDGGDYSAVTRQHAEELIGRLRAEV